MSAESMPTIRDQNCCASHEQVTAGSQRWEGTPLAMNEAVALIDEDRSHLGLWNRRRVRVQRRMLQRSTLGMAGLLDRQLS